MVSILISSLSMQWEGSKQVVFGGFGRDNESAVVVDRNTVTPNFEYLRADTSG